MPINEVVSDVKILYAINNNDKKILTLQEIANAPHHYSYKRLVLFLTKTKYI